jgi:hypothetical protein
VATSQSGERDISPFWRSAKYKTSINDDKSQITVQKSHFFDRFFPSAIAASRPY